MLAWGLWLSTSVCLPFQSQDSVGFTIPQIELKNPPSNAGDTGSIPGQGTMTPHATGHLQALPPASGFRMEQARGWGCLASARRSRNLGLVGLEPARPPPMAWLMGVDFSLV